MNTKIKTGRKKGVCSMIIFSDTETPIEWFFNWIEEKAVNEIVNTEETGDRENM